MNEGKTELYKYIRDQHDKYVAMRESLISRFGNIRLLACLLLTVFSFSISVTIKSLENAQWYLPRLLAALPLILFALALYYVTKALLTIPDLVGNISINLPKVDEKEIMEALKKDTEVNIEEVVEGLSYNYLDALNKNISENEDALSRIRRSAHFIRQGLFATISFLLLTLITSMAVLWLFPKN